MKLDRIQEGEILLWHPPNDHDGILPSRRVTVVEAGPDQDTRIRVMDERGCEFFASPGDLMPRGTGVPVMSEMYLG